MKKAMSPVQWVMFAAALFLMFFNVILPPFNGLSQTGMSIICIIIGTLILMIGVDMSWGPLLCILAFPVSGVYSLADSLKFSFAHSTALFCVFNTMVLFVLKENGVLKRIATWAITRPFARKNPWSFVVVFWFTILIITSFINITAAVVLFTTLAIEICTSVNLKVADRTSKLFMAGTMAVIGISYGTTPIGKPTPISAIGLFQELAEVSIFQYSVVGMIIGVIFVATLVIAMKYIIKMDASPFGSVDFEALTKEKKPMGKDEKLSVIIFVGVIVLWILPDIVKNSVPTLYKFLNKMGIISPAIIACVLMSIIRVNDKPLMNFMQTFRNGAEWGAYLIMTAAMIMSTAINNADGGVVPWMTTLLEPIFGAMDPVLFVLIMGCLCTLITNFTSCTVAVTVVAAIAIPMISGGVVPGVQPGALCIALGVTQALAYMTPPAGTVAAVTVGYNWLTPGEMFKNGAILSLIYGPTLTLISYGLSCLFFF